ncbi:hypothetical protein [uncultured Bilophila sp.]|uniref:hypothetical protein n=1 Tax=uncultured Bilophila sp. TaxID=529385 RepID=UPI00280B20B5|nr:hypothetical protein [uncultured Bilophila sp.]
MAKKPSMPDFTFALGADLREAAAKMRKMSQPPKHQPEQQSDDPVDVPSNDVQEIIVESSTMASTTTESISVPSPNVDATIESDALPMDLSHCSEEEPSVILKLSEEIAVSVDSTGSVVDTTQPLNEVTNVKEDTLVLPPFGIDTEPLEEYEDSQESFSEPSIAQEEYLEPPQSLSSEACSGNVQDTVYISEAGSTSLLSDVQTQPLEASICVDPDEVPGTAYPDKTIKQSMTADNRSEQKKTIDHSTKQYITGSAPKTDTSSYQQSCDNNEFTPTGDDTSLPSISHTEHLSPVDNSLETVTDASSHSLYSQLTYGTSQTVTDYQVYSAPFKVSPHPYGDVSTLPKDPFQTQVVAPKASNPVQTPSQNSREQSQTVTKQTVVSKQPIDTKGFIQKQPVDVQANIPQGLSPSIVAATLQDAHLGGARQVLLDALTALRQQSPQVVVNLKRLAPAIGLSYGTVRNTISRLVREGIICTTQVRTGDAHGVCVEFIDDNPLPSMTAVQRIRPSMVYQQQSQTVMKSHDEGPSVPTDDPCIWNTDADLIAILWPFAADAGFGPAHLAQLRRAYQLQGWESENVSRCLRYLDWELANGVPASHEHVATWLRIMQRQGHYPRPEGYVDPEILRLRQQAEEERELAEARTRFK